MNKIIAFAFLISLHYTDLVIAQNYQLSCITPESAPDTANGSIEINFAPHPDWSFEWRESYEVMAMADNSYLASLVNIDCIVYPHPSAIVFNGFSHNSQNRIFIFYNNPPFEADIRTIVHEFLHNQYTMLHLLTDPIQNCSNHNPPQENGIGYENIMDYCDGRKMRKYQWDFIHQQD